MVDKVQYLVFKDHEVLQNKTNLLIDLLFCLISKFGGQNIYNHDLKT